MNLKQIKKHSQRKNAKNINLWDLHNFISRLGYASYETGKLKDRELNKVYDCMAVDKYYTYYHNHKCLKLKPVKPETLQKIIKYYYGDLIFIKKSYCQYAPEIKKIWLCYNSL